MRLEMLSYLNTIHCGIVALELIADQLVRFAKLSPNEEAADIMLTLSRSHRVKILEMQGQFAAFKRVYSERYHSEA